MTGAASDGGRATALAMAREGAVVVLSDRTPEGVEDTLAAVKARGGEGLSLPADLTKAGEAEGLIARVVETYGRLDCAWNNAGSYGEGDAGRLHECSEDTWDRWMDLHLGTIRLCLRYEIAQMLQQGGGAIVNTAGITGFAGSRTPAASVASRHAVVGLTRAAALDYAKQGIRINAVFPALSCESARALSPTAEEGLPPSPAIRGPSTPDEVAEAVTWLCSDAASLVTGLVLGMERGFPEILGP